MYRSLCDRGSLTEYVYVFPVRNLQLQCYSQLIQPPPPFRSPDLPQLPLGAPNLSVQCTRGNVHSSIYFASVTQSEGTQTTYEAPEPLPTSKIHVDTFWADQSPA